MSSLPDPGLTQPSTHAGIKSVGTYTRSLDLFCCLVFLPALAVSFLVMSAITRLVSPGPVFFSQERVGLRGRRFKIFKFRTMTVNADTTVHQNHFHRLMASNAPMVKLDARRDARLIPGGWVLRASGMDELPQIINVLRGDMSLVGPRPCIPSEYDQYLPAQRERLSVLPGLTGLWQVSGKNRTTFDEMIRLDIQYARKPSLLLNLKIVFLTPWALVVQIHDTRNGRKSSAVPASHANLCPPARSGLSDGQINDQPKRAREIRTTPPMDQSRTSLL